MGEKFDPYRKWLGIPADEQPPNHYRLLGIGLYEDDADTIATAADRQMGHLRTFQTGPHSALSQKLLNECAAARICLLHADKKAAYDRELRRKAAPPPPNQTLSKQPPASVARAELATPLDHLSPLLDPPVPRRSPNQVVPSAPYAMRPPPPRRVSAKSTDRPPPFTRKNWNPSVLIWLAPLVTLAGAVLVIALYAVSSHLSGDLNPTKLVDAQIKEEDADPVPRAEGSQHESLSDNTTEPGDAHKSVPQPNPATAKPSASPSRELTIVEATYGVGDKRLDVVENVRAAMRNGRLVGTVATEIVGRQDPAPGARKALKVRYRLGDEIHAVEASDGEFIYIAVPGTTTATLNAGGLELIEARYGAGLTWVEVLHRVRALVDGDRLAVRADLLAHSDPAPGLRKVLYVRYTVDGSERVAYTYDGQELQIDARSLKPAGPPVDLFKLIDVNRDAVVGVWRLNGSVLESPDKAPYARLQVPHDIPEEYTVTLVAEPGAAVDKDTVIRIGLVGGGTQFQFALHHQAKSGVAVLDDDGWGRGEATFAGLEFKPGVRNTIVCTVRRSGLDFAIDGQLVVEWRGGYRRLSLNPELRIPNPRHLFIGAECAFHIHSLELTPLVPNNPASTPIASAGAPIDLLKIIDPQRDAVSGGWRFDGQDLMAPAEDNARLQIVKVPPDEYTLTLEVSPPVPAGEVTLGLVIAGRQTVAVLDGWQKGVSGLDLIDGRQGNDNATTHHGKVFHSDKPNLIVCSVRKSSVRVECNGKIIIDWKGDAASLSLRPEFAVPGLRQLFLRSNNSTFRISKLVLSPLPAG